MNEERQTRKWRAAKVRVRAALDALDDRRPWLPMEHWAETTKLERDEWIEYYERRERHLAQHPAYDNDWGRPTAETAEQVCQSLKPPMPLEDFFPGLWLSPEYAPELTRTIKRALVVVLDLFVRAGQERRTVTVNQVFDDLAARWSDWFRQAREQGRADRVRDMRLERAIACRRDLILNGVRLDALWRVAAGDWSKKSGKNPLYYVTRTRGRMKNAKKKPAERGGYRVRLRPGEALRGFGNLIRNDPAYRPRGHARRLLLADEKLPPIDSRTPRREICSERPYNIVKLGQQSERLLETMEQSQLLFDVSAFRQDYKRHKRIARRVRGWRARALKERRLTIEDRQQAYEDLRRTFGRRLTIYNRSRKSIEAHARVYEQVRAVEPKVWYPDAPGRRLLSIQSSFFRAKNRRFHAAHFWPEHVRAGLDQTDRTNLPILVTNSSQRDRWFSFAAPDHDPLEPQLGLRGYDISASQTQILAILLGLDDLERLAGPEADKPFKVYLAEQAWHAHCEGRLPLKTGYEKANDLVPLVKDLWTRKLYGGKVREVIWDNPGWVAGNPTKEEYPKAVAEAENNVLNFLESLPWYGKRGDGKVRDFFFACQHMAQVAQKENRYQGVVFTDPFDKAEVRWNPVQRASFPLRSGRVTLYLSLPGRWKDAAHTQYRHYAPDPDTGDYPISGSKLRQMIAPCLVHMLDAYYSALVMERLAELGVRDFVSLHDCWYLPAVVEKRDALGLVTFLKPGEELLGEILHDAAGWWIRGLDVVYDRLSHYLDPPWPAGTVPQRRMRIEHEKREFAPFVRTMKANWERRVAEGRWPRFAFGEAELSRMRQVQVSRAGT